MLIAFKTRKQRGGPLNVPYGCSNKTTQSERRGAEEKLWPLAVYKAFPRLWTHWTEVLQRFHIKSISNVTAMHNYHKHQYHPGNWFSVQLPMSCLYSCNHVDEPAASTALVVEVLCSYVKQHTHTLFFFFSPCLTHTHMKPECHVSISTVCKSGRYSWLRSAEDICLQLNICLAVLSAGTVDNL